MMPRPMTPTVPLYFLGRNHSSFSMVKIETRPMRRAASFIVVGSRAVEWSKVAMRLSCRARDRLSSPAKAVREESCRSELPGLGAMGGNVAARLMEVGHQVTVWNRTPDKTKPLADAGAKVAATPAEVAAASEAVITMLTDGAAIDAVYNGPNGLLSGDVKGKLFIEMSTVAPKVETDLAPKVRAKGAALVECPVGGSTAPARKGQLLGLMGAEPADAARAQADPRTALPQGRALRAGRHRRRDEARDQSAADGGLAGLWRSLCHRAQRRLGAQAPARSVRREQRRQQRAQDARRHDRQNAGGPGSRGRPPSRSPTA